MPTKQLILTFDRSSLPEYINAGFVRCPLLPYIPNPRRSFKCQRFGHGTNTSRDRVTCAKYAQNDHPSENCNVPQFICVNCRGIHAAYSRNCEKFPQEKKIIHIKVTENIT